MKEGSDLIWVPIYVPSPDPCNEPAFVTTAQVLNFGSTKGSAICVLGKSFPKVRRLNGGFEATIVRTGEAEKCIFLNFFKTLANNFN